jgi:hypothetical protein
MGYFFRWKRNGICFVTFDWKHSIFSIYWLPNKELPYFCFAVLWRDYLQKSFWLVKFVSLKCLIPTNFKWISMEWPICERQHSPHQGFLSLIMCWDYWFYLFLSLIMSYKMTYSAFVIISCMSDILIMGCQTKFYQLV